MLVMRISLLIGASCLLLSGCALSKDESTLARLHEEMAHKKKQLPPGSLTEGEVGVHFYPDSDEFQSRQYDEGGYHFLEVGLSTPDSADKVRDFYEKEIGAKAMPMVSPVYSIQRDDRGKHYEVDYGRFSDETNITVKVSWPSP